MSEPKEYIHTSPLPFEKQYVLASDGVFYSREIITTPITNQRNLVESCKFEETMNLNQCVNRLEINDPSRDRSSIPISSCYYEGYYDSDYSKKHIFVPIYAFTFPKADLTKVNINYNIPDVDPVYEYQLTPNQFSRDFTNRVIPKYNPRFYSDRHQMYIHFIISDSNPTNGIMGERRISYPTLFAVNKDTKEPVSMDLPNIYDTGKICTGDSYGRFDMDSSVSTHDIVRNVLIELFSSPANTDLYPREEFVRAYLMYDSEAQCLLLPDRDGSGITNPYATKERGFFFPITKSVIIDFTSLLWKK